MSEGSFRPIKPTSTSQFNYHPLEVTFAGTATASFTMKPQLTLVLWGVPFQIQPEATIGVDVKIGEGSGCSNVLAPFYQLWSVGSEESEDEKGVGRGGHT